MYANFYGIVRWSNLTGNLDYSLRSSCLEPASAIHNKTSRFSNDRHHTGLKNASLRTSFRKARWVFPRFAPSKDKICSIHRWRCLWGGLLRPPAVRSTAALNLISILKQPLYPKGLSPKLSLCCLNLWSNVSCLEDFKYRLHDSSRASWGGTPAFLSDGEFGIHWTTLPAILNEISIKLII